MKKALKIGCMVGGALYVSWKAFGAGVSCGIGAGNTLKTDICKPITTIDDALEDFCETLNVHRLLYYIGQVGARGYNTK